MNQIFLNLWLDILFSASPWRGQGSRLRRRPSRHGESISDVFLLFDCFQFVFTGVVWVSDSWWIGLSSALDFTVRSSPLQATCVDFSFLHGTVFLQCVSAIVGGWAISAARVCTLFKCNEARRAFGLKQCLPMILCSVRSVTWTEHIYDTTPVRMYFHWTVWSQPRCDFSFERLEHRLPLTSCVRSSREGREINKNRSNVSHDF